MQLVCIEAAYGFVTIATQRTEVLNKEAMGYGSVLYTLKSNTAIKSLSDFKGKKIGVGSIVTVGSFLLSWKVRPSASAGCLPDGFFISFLLSLTTFLLAAPRGRRRQHLHRRGPGAPPARRTIKRYGHEKQLKTCS